MYANIRVLVEKEFGAPASKQPAQSTQSPAPSTPLGEPGLTPSNAPPSILPRALNSAKVLTECPIAIVLIFQTYKEVMQPALADFYPLVMESIQIQPEPQRLAHQQAEERGESFVGVAEGITNRAVYTELIKAQVKVSLVIILN
jgi:transformation/transcription domain-associated protein